MLWLIVKQILFQSAVLEKATLKTQIFPHKTAQIPDNNKQKTIFFSNFRAFPSTTRSLIYRLVE